MIRPWAWSQPTKVAGLRSLKTVTKKNPQIVRLRSPICSQNVLACKANFNANPLNILVHLQLLWLHNAYQFKVLLHLLPFGHNLKGEFWDPKFWGLEEWVLAGWASHQSKAHPRLLNTKCCSICRRLAVIPMSSYSTPQNWGVRVDIGVENGTNRNLVPTFLFDFYTHYKPIYIAPFGHNTQRGRQTQRWQ